MAHRISLASSICEDAGGFFPVIHQNDGNLSDIMGKAVFVCPVRFKTVEEAMTAGSRILREGAQQLKAQGWSLPTPD